MADFVTVRVGDFADLDVRSLTRAVQQRFENIFTEGVAVFVEDLGKSLHFQTGESWGSLIPLAARVGANLPFPTRGSAFRNRPSTNQDGTVSEGAPDRSVQTGEAKGADAFQLDFSRGSFLFSFDIPTFQFQLHNNGHAQNSGTMEGALDRAEIQMLLHLEFVARPAMSRLVNEWLNTGRVSGA